VSDVLQVCVDLGSTRAGVNRGRTCNAFNVVRETVLARRASERG
jgi:hypothetical protein